MASQFCGHQLSCKMIVVLVYAGGGGSWGEKATLAGCGDTCTPVMLRTGNWGRRIVSLGSLSLWKEGGGGRQGTLHHVCAILRIILCLKKKKFSKHQGGDGLLNQCQLVSACLLVYAMCRWRYHNTRRTWLPWIRWGLKDAPFQTLRGWTQTPTKGNGEPMYHTLCMGTEGPGMHSLN